MSFRQDGHCKHDERRTWEEWKTANADLLRQCGLPPSVLRTSDDWQYLLRYGYWCENFYGEHAGNVDFTMDQLNPDQRDAFRQLLERTLTAEEKARGSAAWHQFHPPGGVDS